MNTKTHCLVAGLAAGLGATTAMADANVSSGATADEVRAIVAEMLSDAETRSSLLQGGGSAGWDDGFFIESGDGSFRLNIGALVQFRYVASFGDDLGGNVDNDFDGDFQTRTTRLIFDGHIYDDWFFKVQGNFSESEATSGDSDLNLENAYVGYSFEDGGSLIVGQMKVPLLREELVDQGHQLAVDRSLTNEYFTAGYTQGVAYKWDSESFRWTAALTDGANQRNSDLNSNGLGNSDFSITWRGEFLLSGSWEQFDDFTSPMGSEDGFLIGVAGHYQTGPGDTANDADIFAYTGDISYEGDGWNVFLAGMGRDIDPDTGADFHDYGLVLHGGIYVTEDTELYGRYSHVFLDDDVLAPGSEDENAAFTVGVNHYLHGHAAKLSVDVVYYLDEAIATPFGGGLGTDTTIGRLGDTDDGEVSIRAQMQLMF